MKHLLSLLLLITLLNPIASQINGNGKIKSLSQNVPNLQNIDVQFNANIVLDYDQEEVMVIEADENILEYIGIYFENGSLVLDQIKWIEPSQQPTITIGSPNLKSVYQGTHSTTKIVNAKGAALTLEGNVGKIIATGQIDKLIVNTEDTKVNAENLKIGTVQIKDKCESVVILDKFDKLLKSESSKADIISKNSDNWKKQKEAAKSKEKVTYIKFKIKNNTARRNAYYVKGPNGRGGKFSYGFSLFPYASKAENWSIGTKVYEESRLGTLKKLVEITAEDEGKVVELH